MPRIARTTILQALRAKVARGRAIVGGGAGTGLSAKCEEAGGIDLIVIYNSGRYRMAGRGSLAGYLAYGNANEIVCDMAREVLPVVRHTPVLAGVNATDPFMLRDDLLRRLQDLGFSGVQNFPSVGLIDGRFRAELEATGMGYGHEVDLVAEVGGELIPFEVKYRARHTGARELKGLMELCQARRIARGYVVTKALDDFGPMRGLAGAGEGAVAGADAGVTPVAGGDGLGGSAGVSTQIMRIPATLLCYWMGATEGAEAV